MRLRRQVHQRRRARPLLPNPRCAVSYVGAAHFIGRAESGFTERLQTYINDARHNTQWRMQYMTWERQQAYAFESGQERGIAQTRFETARNFLRLGVPVEQVAQGAELPLAEVQRIAADLKR